MKPVKINLKKKIRKSLIKLGEYREISDEEWAKYSRYDDIRQGIRDCMAIFDELNDALCVLESAEDEECKT